MVREAIGELRGGGTITRWVVDPIVWSGVALVLAVSVFSGTLPVALGIVLLTGSVVAVAWLAAWRSARQLAPLDTRALAFAVTGDGSWDYDLRTGSIVYDERCASMLGYPPGSVASHLGAWGKLVHPDDLPHAREALDAFVAGRAESYGVEVRLKAADGHWCRVLDRARVVERDGAGRAVRLVGVHRLLPDADQPRRSAEVTLETASVSDLIERALATRGEPKIRVAMRRSDDLGAAWVDGVTLTRGIARLLDAVAEQVPDGTIVRVRPRAPRELDMVGFSIGLPPCASVDPASRHVEAARSLLLNSGGRLRIRHDQIVVELPAARGRRLSV